MSSVARVGANAVKDVTGGKPRKGYGRRIVCGRLRPLVKCEPGWGCRRRMEVVFITFLLAVFCVTACAASPTSLALGKPSSLVRRGKLPMASGARVAFAKHAVKQPSGGEAKPRLTSPTSAVVVLASVERCQQPVCCVSRVARDVVIAVWGSLWGRYHHQRWDQLSAMCGLRTTYCSRSSLSWEAVLHPCRARNGLRAT